MATLSSLLPASVVTNLAAGDSDVAVTDTGTGKVEVTVDNVEVADFTTGEIVFNETGANQDFRVEGDSNANLIVADAGVDKVGIGTNTFNTNGGVLQVSNGISFPATQSALSDGNTLDDYEEGTWTGTLEGSVSNPSTPVTATGKYVKVGKQVTLSIQFLSVNTTGASGNAYISGVPFNPDANGFGSVAASNFTFNAGQTSVACFMNTGNNILTIFTTGTGATFAELQHSAGSGRTIWAGITYFV